jgi:hypothetical protein
MTHCPRCITLRTEYIIDVTVPPVQAMKTTRAMEVYLHPFLSPPFHWNDWSDPRRGHFIPGEKVAGKH